MKSRFEVIFILILLICIVAISGCAAQPTVTVTVAPPPLATTPPLSPTDKAPPANTVPPARTTPPPMTTMPPRPPTTSTAPLQALTIVGQLPMSDSIELAPLDENAINKLDPHPNVPFNIGGWYRSPLIYLFAGKTINIVIESNTKVSWEIFTLTNQVSADIVKVGNTEYSFGYSDPNKNCTQSIFNNGTQKITVVFSPDTSGYYDLSLINNSSTSHYCNITISSPQP